MNPRTGTGRRVLYCCGWLVACLVFVCGLPAADATSDPLADIRHLPANNPYRKTLEQWLSLPREQRDALSSWAGKKADGEPPAPPLTPEQSEWVASLSASLRTASRQPDAADIWPLVPSATEPDNLMAATLPHISVVMDVGRLVARGTENLPTRDAIETDAALAQMGRRMRAGGVLIGDLVGVSLESLATAGIAKRLGEFSAADLDAVRAAWAGLKASPGADQALRAERDVFFEPFLKQILKPGLAALLAEQAGLADNAPTSNGVGSNLRLTALISDGQRMIGLEDTTKGRSFFVGEGKTVNGVTLVSIDFKQNRAALRIGDKDAILDLTSKRIVERQAAANRLIHMLGMANSFADAPAPGADELLRSLVQHARDHPGGLDGYIQQLMSAYDKTLAQSLLRAEQPKMDADPTTHPAQDPVLAVLMPSFDSLVRTLNKSDLSTTMLNAALTLRRQELAGAPLQTPHDPWGQSGDNLQMERSPDGGFILRSVYEGRAGKPVEYKFAAPDAGMMRR